MKKLQKYKNQSLTNVARIQQRLVAVAGSWHRQDTGNRMLSDSGAGWIPTIDNC
jgi:hypothetical protein